MKRVLTLAAFALCAALWSTLWSPAAHAVLPGEMLADPALEQRARELSQGVRCQVCMNQTIDDSNAPLAADLRILVRERLTAGDTNQQVLDYLVKRYGDYVLMRPPVRPSTWALWFGAPAILLLAAGGLFVARRRRAAEAPPPPLSEDEERKLAALLKRAAR